jgi:hypothetical protein
VKSPSIRRALACAVLVAVVAGLTAAQATAGDTPSWQRLAQSRSSDPPVIGYNADGRMEIFRRDGNHVLHSWQFVGGGWSGWYDMGGDLVDFSEPAVANEADGRLVVAAVFRDGTLHVAKQYGPNSGWTGWSGSLATNLTSAMAPAAALDGANRLHVLAVTASLDGTGAAGVVDLAEQSANGVWAAPVMLSTTLVIGFNRAIQVVRNADGRLDVFESGWHTSYYDAIFVHIPQTADGGWGDWSSLGATGDDYPWQVVRKSDGRLTLFSFNNVRGRYVEQLTPSGAWGAWADLSTQLPAGKAPVSVNVAQAGDGRLEMFVVASVTSRNGNLHRTELWHTRALDSATGWTAWEDAGSVGTNDGALAYVSWPALSLDRSGRLQLLGWKEGDQPSPPYDLWLLGQSPSTGGWSFNPDWPEPTAMTSLPNYQDAQGDYVAARMSDDELETFFWSNRSPQPGDYIGVDLGAARTVHTVEFLMGKPDRLNDYIHQGSVECSGDGTTWVSLGSFSQLADVRVSVPGGTTCRKLRYRANASQYWWVVTREINVS